VKEQELTLKQAEIMLSQLKMMLDRHETPEAWQQYYLVKQLARLLKEKSESWFQKYDRIMGEKKR